MFESKVIFRMTLNHTRESVCAFLVWVILLLLLPYDTQAQNSGICDQTPGIRDATLKHLTDQQCESVTSTQSQLLAITDIRVPKKNISVLKAVDFEVEGLSNLDYLYSYDNSLTSLPEGILNGLTNLSTLHLYSNDLTSLHENQFDDLASLKLLSLVGNDLTEFPYNLFDFTTSDPTPIASLQNNDAECSPPSTVDNRYVDLGHPNILKKCALPVVTLVLSESSIEENRGTTILKATLEEASSETTTITIGLDPDGTTTDYTVDTDPLTLTIASGETTSNLIKITAVNNEIHESDKIFTISGDATENVTGPAEITLTITDDELPTISLELSSSSTFEDSPVDLWATLSAP